MVKMATRNAPTGELAGKVAVVTGAAPGVGRAAALALARVGAHIAGIDIAARVSMILDVAPTPHEDRYAQVINAAGQQPPVDPVRGEHAAIRQLTAKTPPDDIAPVMMFLTSDAARMVSGATVAAQSLNRLTHNEIRDRASRTGVDRSRGSSREHAMFIRVESHGGDVLRRL
jgi:NAD(P)-dependent dehydrogenase (short-subunit alcohol dehydrogenase family)